jgi:hypothetical protein
VTATNGEQATTPTVTVTTWVDCGDCGQPFYRARTFEGPDATEDAARWDPERRCASCVFGFARAEGAA